MKPPAFACKEFIRAEIFHPSEEIFQDQRQHDSYCSCHLTASLEVNPSSGKRICHFALKTKVKEIFKPAQGVKMFEVDFHEANKDEQAPYHVDRKFMKKAKEGIHHRNNGHYELPLPLKDERTLLPNNRELALSRNKKLKGRLKHNATYRKDYQGFMREVIEKGYAFRPKNCVLIMATYGTFPITEFIIQRNRARLVWFLTQVLNSKEGL